MTHTDPRTVLPPPEVRDYALAAIHRLGPGPAAKALGVSRQTVQTIALGGQCLRGSVALVREAMRARGEL